MRFELPPAEREGGAPQPLFENYVPTLDGWRAVAVILVLMAHSRDSLQRSIGPIWGFLEPLMTLGGLGVNVFFAISGVLITNRLMEERWRTNTISLRSFYIRRIFRLLPALIAFLFTIGLLTGLLGLYVPFWQLARALLFASNYGPVPVWYLAHTWSLAIEEHFYLFWPLALLALTPRRCMVGALVLCVVVTVWRIACIKLSLVPVEFGVSPWRSDVQIDAIIVPALILLWATTSTRCKRWLGTFCSNAGGVSFIFLTIAYVVCESNSTLRQLLRIVQPFAIGLIILSTCIDARGAFSRFLETRWLRWVGRLSYSLYLWQQLFLVPDRDVVAGLAGVQAFPINILMTFAAAVLCFYFVEKPFIRIGHKVARPVTAGRGDVLS